MEFEPRIVLRMDADLPAHMRSEFVVRYGVMPDGAEVMLGRTMDENLGQALEKYRGLLEIHGYKSASRLVVPYRHWSRARIVWENVKRFLTGKRVVVVEGTEFGPYPPLKA